MKVMLKVRSILSIAFLFRGVNMEKVVKIISVSILAIIILGFVWFVLDYTFGLAPTEIVTVVDEDTGFTYEYNKNSLNTRLSNFLDFTKVALYIEVALSFVLAACKGKNGEIEKRNAFIILGIILLVVLLAWQVLFAPPMNVTAD